MARVFGIQYNAHYNWKPTKAFGDLNYIFTDKTPEISNPQKFIEEVQLRLENFSFDPKTDFIVLTGTTNNVCLFICSAMLAYGEIRLLLFDSVRNSYYERLIKDPAPEEV
jgi:hypothetical protein